MLKTGAKVAILSSICFLLIAALFPAQACVAFNSRGLAQIARADVVIVGKFLGYRQVIFGERLRVDNYGVLEFKTIETWRGDDRPSWRFFWWNPTGPGVPADFSVEGRTVIAGMWRNSAYLHHRLPEAAVKEENVMQLIHPSCGMPLLFDLSEPLRVDVERLRALVEKSN